ncbi:MAG TPA: hypothetical protein VH370_08295 [Humisphaera sp.]|jgi:hypothetical protein|nr:hypothetical protein [Humisphaera sp.]
MTSSPKIRAIPRRLPLRRKAWSALILFASLLFLWLWWAHIANQRLAAQVAAIAARGEPLYPKDFDPPPVPAGQNAATYFAAACSAIVFPPATPSSSSMSYAGYPPFPQAWHDAANQAVAANQQTLQLARKAQAYAQADWGHGHAAHRAQWPMRASPNLNGLRYLANLLGDAALLAHEQGNDLEAIERIRDLLHEADAIDNHSISIINHLTGYGIEALAVDRLEVIAPDLRVDTELGATPAPSPKGSPAAAATIREMIHELLNEQWSHERSLACALAIRMEEFDTLDELSERSDLLKPMVQLDAVRLLEDTQWGLRAVEQPNWPSAEAMLAARPRLFAESSSYGPQPAETKIRFSHFLASEVGMRIESLILQEFRHVAERRVAATALAVRLYRAEHHSWPARLDDLCPGFLPTVPIDPFSADGKPLGYVILRAVLPGGADRPLLFLNAPNETVDKAPPQPSFGWAGKNTQWRDLARWAPSSTKAVNDDPHQPDNTGEQAKTDGR